MRLRNLKTSHLVVAGHSLGAASAAVIVNEHSAMAIGWERPVEMSVEAYCFGLPSVFHPSHPNWSRKAGMSDVHVFCGTLQTEPIFFTFLDCIRIQI